jgi:hypothetical protein
MHGNDLLRLCLFRLFSLAGFVDRLQDVRQESERPAPRCGVCRPHTGGTMPTAEIQDLKIINRDPTYHGWPTVARRRNGELLVVCSGGREEHVDPFGQVHLIRSADGGNTWSAPQVVADGPLDDRDAGVLETRSGALLINWFTSLAWMHYLYRAETGQIDWIPRATLDRWRAERQRIVDAVNVRAELGEWIIQSEDGGKTWSPRVATGLSSPHGPIQLADGRLLYAGKRTTAPNGWARGSSHEGGEIGVAESRDDGRTWQWIGAVPVAPGHTAADYHEPHAVETADGRLVLQIRNHGTPFTQETLQTESEDGGRTWSVSHSIGVWGTPSHLLRLRDGRLLMTNGYRRQPFGNQARVSSDSGRTWSDPMTISGDGMGGDLGYPSSVELDDGLILSVWYEVLKGNPRAVLRQARWRMLD